MASHSPTTEPTLPYWSASAALPTFRELDRDLDVDVVVIGGGITGLTAAYLLVTAGKSVALIERARCASIDTGHTTAHLTMVTDTQLTELSRRFGRTHAQAVWDAGLAAIGQIDAIVGEEAIDCRFDWVDGYLHAANAKAAEKQRDEFREEAALATQLGFDATFVSDVPFVGGPGVCFEGQARFHPRRYLAGVATAVRAKGAHIFEHSDAEDFREKPLSVKANGFWARCKDIVIATHNPLVGLSSMTSATLFQTKLALFSSYVVAGRVPSGAVPDALFWDSETAYHYLRVDRHPDHDVVIFGGEDHKTGQASDTNVCYEHLERALLERVPTLSVTHRWSGQVIETPDGLPYIGRMAEHQYAATGFGGNGMTFGTLGAMMIADAILGRRNPWTDLFDPGRIALTHGLWEYIKENSDYPYYRMRDRLTGAEGRSLRAVKRGEGTIIDRGGKKVAASRDERGALTLRSAVCTHMGCLVSWNDAERTWDCPCHGSRFTPKGTVISGPAGAPLEETNG
jgi:glycine/D-amino acid oxidase-like deaminating enzyme/nitrite reductase/ring-hydroxylating ferredoxin subunit